jgi:hypothetical protein
LSLCSVLTTPSLSGSFSVVGWQQEFTSHILDFDDAFA